MKTLLIGIQPRKKGSAEGRKKVINTSLMKSSINTAKNTFLNSKINSL